MTQKIRFDENGQRDEFYLEVLEFSPKNGFQKIATWDQTLGINLTRNFSDLEVQIIESTQNKTLEVLSRMAPPFLFKMYARRIDFFVSFFNFDCCSLLTPQ